jgi:LPS-assembly protein
MREDWVERMSAGTGRMLRLMAGTGMVSVLALSHAFAQAPLVPQPRTPQPGAPQAGSQDRMLIEARELVYNNDRNTVEALGDVQIFYQGRTLEADRVTYNQTTKRVFAEGNARLTESNGQVVTGSRFELTDDFRDGFIDSLRTQNPDRSRFAAPRAERSGGDTVSFETGTYTACEPCKDNPEKPPLWQVKSRRIIHKGDEKTIYFESSTLEFAGVPIAYIPYFWSPDSTVRRKTGLLAPNIYSSNALGVGIGVPVFINLAPNYDLTLTPTVLSRQGFLGVAEWRHRLVNGSYSIRAAGIFQSDPKAFADPPLGASDKRFRGSIETRGRFDINQNWRFGWDISGSTDRYFYNNYRLFPQGLTATFFREVTSSVFLNGQSANAWFDMRAYHFRPLNYLDWQKQQPIVHPALEYDKRFDGPGYLGGEVRVEANITSLSRDTAGFQTIPSPANRFTRAYLATQNGTSVYEGCFLYQRGECLLRGVGGTASRASIGVSWRRQMVDPIGQVWTPFASFRMDGFYTTLNSGGFAGINDQQGALGASEGSFARIMPAIGLTYSYPLVVGGGGSGAHIVSPIVQIVARPNESNIARTPNEDSQSLIFDDSNLFQMSRFSGYDRNEGGIRLNYGVQYSGVFANGVTANALFGQSYQLAGVNSYAVADMAGGGLNSGLETRQSDYVGRLQVAPTPYGVFTAKGRFDQRTFSAKSLEFSAFASADPVWASVTYARYDAQPERAQPFRREGIAFGGGVKLGQFWSVRGSVLYDLDQYLSRRAVALANRQPDPKSPRWAVSSLGLGLNYTDECTIFDISYFTSFRDKVSGERTTTNQGVLLRLELRTLGEVGFRQSIGGQSGSSVDGIRAP